MPILPAENLKALENEYGIIRLLHHRNKNQHRVATWWKHFNTLKRSLTKLISLLYRDQKCPNEGVRRNIYETVYYINTFVIKSCYWAFNGIIALGQFITLGMTLIGILGKVRFEILQVEGFPEYLDLKQSKQINGVNADGFGNVADDIGEEIGEEILPEIKTETITISEEVKKRPSTSELFAIDNRKKKKVKKEDMNATSSPSVTKDSKEKKKKKKKKSAIDDIFG